MGVIVVCVLLDQPITIQGGEERLWCGEPSILDLTDRSTELSV